MTEYKKEALDEKLTGKIDKPKNPLG